MAVYDPPQPLWKRNAAGVLDFLFCFIFFGYVLTLFFGDKSRAPVLVSNSAGQVTTHPFISLSGLPALVLLGVTILYFVLLGRSGGTLFQRLFRMRRAR